MDVVVVAQIVIDTAITFVRAVSVNLLDQLGNLLIFLLSGTFLAGCPLVIGGAGNMEQFTHRLNRIILFL